MAVEIAEITRTYGGLEGRRVKAGTRFSIDKPAAGMITISKGRFQQLKDAGLAREYDPTGKKGEPAQPSPGATGATVRQRPLNESRTARKARNKNAGAPSEPRPLVNPALGSLSTPVKLESLSPEAQASVKSNLGLRGRRGLSASRSTTPIKSPPGPESSTDATAAGGATTTGPQDSKV